MPKPDRCPVAGKVRWPDGKSAVEALHIAKVKSVRDVEEGRNPRRREVRHYRCAACKGFHLTSKPGQAFAA